MLAAERKKKSSLAKSPQVPHSATDARETCMAQLVLVAQQSRVIGELEMKLAKMEEDKVRLQNENTQLKFALKLNTKTIEGLRGELQKLAQAHQRTLSRCCKAHFSMGFCCASLFFPLLCVVACKKQETGKKSLFNVALVHALFVLCFILLLLAISAVSLVLCLSSLDWRYLAAFPCNSNSNRKFGGASLWGCSVYGPHVG